MLLVCFHLAAAQPAAADGRLIGIWSLDDGFQIVETAFRSDGRYRIDTRSIDATPGFHFVEHGRYTTAGSTLDLSPYEYFGEPQSRPYLFRLETGLLVLERPEFFLTETYRFQPGSREQVLAAEQAPRDPVGSWRRENASAGHDTYTFRPDGVFRMVRTHGDGPFPPEIVRGRYTLDGGRMSLHPFGGVVAERELDFFGDTLILIREEPLSGDATHYQQIPGSPAAVQTLTAEAAAFLARDDWFVGVWEIRESFLTVDLTLRPDAHYIAVNTTEFLEGTVRGRFALEPRRITLTPFPGQGAYARSNGDFGKVERSRQLDYYDGELHFIDPEALFHPVVIARQRPGSTEPVAAKVLEAQAERTRDGWHVGLWEVHDPVGWMQFTFRPDGRYLAMAGTDGVPGQVERGRYAIGTERITLAPYPGNGAARGFHLDLYDGDLFLAGDLIRLVIARKVPGSESGVVARTLDPDSRKGELGTLLGRWSAPLPGHSAELVFRDDGQFRLDRCAHGLASRDYGLYGVDMASGTLIMDSRFAPVRTLGLDFYGDTMTVFGDAGGPHTYRVRLGEAHAAIQASFAADADRARIDAQWLDRVPVAPRDPAAVQLPAGDIPADPRPDRIFPDPTVLPQYRLYRRLIPGQVVFNVQGTLRSVTVVNSREWHFFPTGRVLVRFRNHFAGVVYPNTIVDVTDAWGAYRVDPKPPQTDILHLYANNAVWISMDSGEDMEMTLEDGRRHLFWGKDHQLLAEWASEQQPVPCDLPDPAEPRLLNTGIALATSIPPDPTGDGHLALTALQVSPDGDLTLHGTTDLPGTVVVDTTLTLAAPATWSPLRTNQVQAGSFTLPVPRPTNASGFFRLRRP